MKIILALTILLISFQIGFAQSEDKLTAEEIINSSIEQIGGENKINAIKTSEMAYIFNTSTNERASIIEKRINSKSFVQSILSEEHVAQTTFFNGEKVIKVEGESVYEFEDKITIEDISLKTFNHIQYGYKKLGYDFERLSDKNFDYFDCYVVRAVSKTGYTTLNYIDKTNFRLIMVIYPNGNKSLLQEQVDYNGILYNSKIMNVNNGDETSVLNLLDVKTNNKIADVWFESPHNSRVKLPDNIRIGKFKPVNLSSILTRTEFEQVETINQDRAFINKVKWKFNDIFILENENIPKTNQDILVKIVSWNENEYVCHFISGNSLGTQEYRTVE